MTRFESDYKDAKEGNEIEIISKRKAKIESLTREGKSCKNGFRRTCIAQEITRLKAELRKIEELFQNGSTEKSKNGANRLCILLLRLADGRSFFMP